MRACCSFGFVLSGVVCASSAGIDLGVDVFTLLGELMSGTSSIATGKAPIGSSEALWLFEGDDVAAGEDALS